ncbi:Phospholipase A1-Ialpha2, chloroplastic [Melia azedarach]|uniref:Phospholipase A1-Ialpha2, chloroplastic n=1 Tax=Melia azedarach TaxID=155640 RepID=A0ACC1YHA5_MELAZ|nr:Phospholipase A1-Ialpha2, chloroplastic [Melia azedarach]
MICQARKSVIASGMLPVNKLQASSRVAKACSMLAHFWREIHGFNNWENLVDPLHPLLRQEIIRYGEFVAACYKAFDLDPNSKRYLNCKYGKKNMLREIGMEDSGYEVTKYIYATPEINIPIQNYASSCGRWIGYVAVSSDASVKRLGRRDIVITFRGTVTNPEWIANFMSSLTSARLDPNNPRPEVKVESGFLSLYTSDENDKFGVGSCREQLLSEVSRLLSKYKEEELSITLAGHSMGSSLALLLAYDIAELGLNKRTTVTSSNQSDIAVTVFSYGGPRVGNAEFKHRCEELGVKVLRIVNTNDPITKLPGVLFNENFRVLGGRIEFPWSCSCYAHVGVELVLDFFNMQNPSCVHDLETYISLLKSPNTAMQQQIQSRRQKDQRAAEIFLNKAREFIFTTQNFNMLQPWKIVASRATW